MTVAPLNRSLDQELAALEPLYPEHVEILGKVTGVFRSL